MTSANGLAADIQLFSSRRARAGLPPSAGYRFKKYVTRHKVALATCGAGRGALSHGRSALEIRGRAVGTHEADFQRQQAETNAGEAQQQTAEAQRSQRETQQARQETVRQRNAVYQNLYNADMRLGLVD